MKIFFFIFLKKILAILYETFIIVSAKGRKELTNMTKKDLIIHLEVELEMKKEMP